MEWLPSPVLFRRSIDKVKMPPPKKARVDPDATEANLSWTDAKQSTSSAIKCG